MKHLPEMDDINQTIFFYSFWSDITPFLQNESRIQIIEQLPQINHVNHAIKHLPQMNHVISARMKIHRLFPSFYFWNGITTLLQKESGNETLKQFASFNIYLRYAMLFWQD